MGNVLNQYNIYKIMSDIKIYYVLALTKDGARSVFKNKIDEIILYSPVLVNVSDINNINNVYEVKYKCTQTKFSDSIDNYTMLTHVTYIATNDIINIKALLLKYISEIDAIVADNSTIKTYITDNISILSTSLYVTDIKNICTEKIIISDTNSIIDYDVYNIYMVGYNDYRASFGVMDMRGLYRDLNDYIVTNDIIKIKDYFVENINLTDNRFFRGVYKFNSIKFINSVFHFKNDYAANIIYKVSSKNEDRYVLATDEDVAILNVRKYMPTFNIIGVNKYVNCIVRI